MVDSGEDSVQAATREFLEETMDSENLSADQMNHLKQRVGKVLSKSEVVSNTRYDYIIIFYNTAICFPLNVNEEPG